MQTAVATHPRLFGPPPTSLFDVGRKFGRVWAGRHASFADLDRLRAEEPALRAEARGNSFKLGLLAGALELLRECEAGPCCRLA